MAMLGGVEQRQSGDKTHPLPREGSQLCAGALLGVGLAQDLVVEQGYLVGADDQVARVGVGQRFGLGQRQPLHQ